MNQDMLSSTSVLQRLLKTNRPPTDAERAVIVESMAPTQAKLNIAREQISEMIAHIEALKLQVEQAEIKLQRLREEEVAILGTFADHDRVFSPFRNLPDDVLHEICDKCMQSDMPKLAYGHNPTPYILSHTCSSMRHVALTMPCLWASMHVDIGPNYSYRFQLRAGHYAILAQRAIEWLKRAGNLALTVTILDSRSLRAPLNGGVDSDPTSVLFRALLSFSIRWKEFQFTTCHQTLPTSMIHIAALKAADLPLLESVSLSFEPHESILNTVLHDSEWLKIPTLRDLSLINAVQMFTANFAVLQSVTLRTRAENGIIGRILQQATKLVHCNITSYCSEEHYPHKINLPFLETLRIAEYNPGIIPIGTHSILEAITAPNLEIFESDVHFFDFALPSFIKRSPRIQKLALLYFEQDESFTNTIEILRHCPLLAALSLRAHDRYRVIANADGLLRAFVDEGYSGVICPRLQDFDCSGQTDFSPETLRMFLERKQRDTVVMNVLPWKNVGIDTYGIKSSEKRQQIFDLASQKKAAGLNVYVHM